MKYTSRFNRILLATAFTMAALNASVFAVDVMDSSKPTIVLIHGAFEDGSIWKLVAAKLESDGYKTITINLPGRDNDTTPKAKITQATYRDYVLQKISGEKKPVVLVGHSFGGITISSVAEVAPKKIKSLVYVAAYLPKSSQSLQTLSSSDKDSKMGPYFMVDPKKMVASIKYDARTDLFLNDANEEQRKGFADSMVDEPLQPIGTPITLTTDHFGSVPRAYIHTARDQVVSPTLQAKMVKMSPVKMELTIDSGHAPFITHADELATDLEKLAQ